MVNWLKRSLLSKALATAAVFALFSCGSETGEKGTVVGNDTSGISVSEVPTNGPKKVDPDDPRLNGNEYIEKYPNGVVRFKGYVVGGYREGQWISFYPNGNPWSQNIYKRGKLDGVTITFYENGKVRYKGAYHDDQRTGHWVFYNENGDKIEEHDYDKKP